MPARRLEANTSILVTIIEYFTIIQNYIKSMRSLADVSRAENDIIITLQLSLENLNYCLLLRV